MPAAKDIPTISIQRFSSAVVVGTGPYVTLSSCWNPGPGIRRWRTAKFARLCIASDCAAPGGCRGVKNHKVFRVSELPVRKPGRPPLVAPAAPVLAGTEHAEQFAKWMEELNKGKAESRLARRKRIRKERLAAGICPTCGKSPTATGRKRCQPCLDYFRDAARRKRLPGVVEAAHKALRDADLALA